jgi:(2Fe-2S) ferredoxin
MARRIRQPDPPADDLMSDYERSRARRSFLMTTNRPDLVALREALKTARDEGEWWRVVDAADLRSWAARHHEMWRRINTDRAARTPPATPE